MLTRVRSQNPLPDERPRLPAARSRVTGRSRARVVRRAAQLLVLTGVAAAVVLLVSMKGAATGAPAARMPVATEAPETALDRAIAAGRPTLAFFHSRTCESCIEMSKTVGEVYPLFRQTVALVDVDVYDPQNESMLTTGRIVAIPTVVLIDRGGNGKWYPGTMTDDELRALLAALVAGR